MRCTGVGIDVEVCWCSLVAFCLNFMNLDVVLERILNVLLFTSVSVLGFACIIYPKRLYTLMHATPSGTINKTKIRTQPFNYIYAGGYIDK